MIEKWLHQVDKLASSTFFWCLIATSILVAAWMQTIQHGWINADSVLYLEQARLFAHGEWSASFAVFNWPLYGISIGLTHKLTGLPIHMSAQLLNMLFFGLATASFLQLIKLAGGNNRTWLMGTLLLFSSQYIVGDVLEMLMRDEGFWAFYLTALVFLVRYLQHNKMTDALLWQLSIIIATLFRIEAILYLLLLPPIYLLISSRFSVGYKLKHLLSTYSISLLIGLGITITIWSQPELSIANFGRLKEAFSSNLHQEVTQKFFTQANVMSDAVLGRYLKEFAVPGLILTFVYAIFSKILTTTGLIGSSLAVLNVKTIQLPSSIAQRVLFVTGAISIITMALIIMKVFVLSGRYVAAFSWILLILASFYLTSLSLNRDKKHRLIFIAICCALGLGIIKNVLPKGAGYNYMQEASIWVKSQQKETESIFYSDPRMRYYAQAGFTGKWSNGWEKINKEMNAGTLQEKHYLVIRHSPKYSKRETETLSKLQGFKEVKRFYDRKKRKYVAVYKKLD